MNDDTSNVILQERVSRLEEQVRKVEDLKRAVEERELRFLTLFHNAGDAIFIHEPEGRFIEVNEAACRRLGYSREELLTKSPKDIDTPEYADQLSERVRSMLLTGRASFETAHVTRNGKIIPVELSATVIDYEGRPAVLSIARDISRRKRAEAKMQETKTRLAKLAKEKTAELQKANDRLKTELGERKKREEELEISERKYRLLAENISDVIWTADLNLRFTYVTPSILQRLGYTPEEFLKLRVEDIVHPSFHKALLDAFEQRKELERLGKGDDHARSWEIQCMAKDGSTVWVESATKALRDSSGRFQGVLGINRDIGERKRTEEQVKSSLKEKEVLLKEVHHRIKNNLQVISSLLNLQASKIHDDQTVHALRDCQGRIKAMALAHQSLYGSDDLQSVDFVSYLSDLARTVFHSYETRGGAAKLHINAPKKFKLPMDRAVPVGIVVNELLSNALKYAFPDQREGVVRLEILPQVDDELLVVCSDNGVGLPEGYDWRKTGTLGFQLVVGLIEGQLDGSVKLLQQGETRFELRIKTEARPS